MSIPPELWPWIALAGLGAFHGLNPAMGWLFAVALGMHRGGRRTVLMSLAPIAVGHLAAIAATLAVLVGFGLVIHPGTLAKACGAALIAWAAWHLAAGHRRRVRIGMSTGMAGLTVWSFLMAVGHGAGLMLAAVALPLCLSGAAGADAASGPFGTAVMAVALHTAAMLAVIAAVAVTVYDWAGVGFLRRGWINVEIVWSAALAASGVVLLVA